MSWHFPNRISLPLEALLLLLVFSLFCQEACSLSCVRNKNYDRKQLRKLGMLSNFSKRARELSLILILVLVMQPIMCTCVIVSFIFLSSQRRNRFTSWLRALLKFLICEHSSAQNLALELPFDWKWHLWNEPALLFHLLSGALRYNSNTSSYIALWIDWHTSLVC